MKRSYPYAGGPTGGQQAGAPVTTGTAPDYSAYGYGSTPGNAASLSSDAQQAQWHQQWQQYYAQQAAATAGTQGSPPAARPAQGLGAPAGQAYGYAAGAAPHASQPAPPQAQQPPQQYYGQYSPQQPQAGPSSYGWNAAAATQPQPVYGAPPQPAHPGMHHSAPPPGQQGYYGGGAASPSGPANKRPRTDNGYGAQGYTGGQPYPPTPSYNAQPRPLASGNTGTWQQPQQQPNFSSPAPPRGPAAQHPIPGRPQLGPMAVPHTGGPSNMAGPMAANSRNAGLSSRSQNNRSSRNQHQGSGRLHGGQGANSNSNLPTGPGKFNGPVGVNAVSPLTGTRTGFGQSHNQQMRKAPQPASGARASSSGTQANGKGGRADANRTKGSVPKGPAAAKNATEGGLEMDKAPLLQGRTSTPVDQPVPVTAKRTFTDFKFNAIEIEPLQWQWQRTDEDVQDGDDDDDTVHEQQSQAGDAATEEKAPSLHDENMSRRARKRAEVNRRRFESGKDICRLRVSFAANPPPAGAPTGPKALLNTTETKSNSAEEVKAEEQGTDDMTSNEANVDEAHKSESPSTTEWTAFTRGPPQSSTNRMTISYASAKRRLVIDADVIKLVEVHRAQATMRIVVDVSTIACGKRKDRREKRKGEEWVVAKGVLLEARRAESDNFAAVPRSELESCWRERRKAVKQEVGGDPTAAKTGDEAEVEKPNVEEEDAKMEGGTAEVGDKPAFDAPSAPVDREVSVLEREASSKGANSEEHTSVLDDYESLPPLYRLLSYHDGPAEDADHPAHEASELIITLSLDDAPHEAKWLRTGDVAEWLAALPGVQTSLVNDPLRTWVSKFRVVDPDPPPTLSDVYDEWVKKSYVGTALHRRQFLQDHQMRLSAGLTEVFARLVAAQGDRPSNTPGVKDLAKPLQDSLARSMFDSHHNYASLAVWTLLGMTREYAGLASIVEENVATRLQELLLCMPMHLIFRSLDGLCKEALDKQRLLQAKSRRNKQGQARSTAGGSASATAAAVEGEGTASAEPSSRAGSVAASVVPAVETLPVRVPDAGEASTVEQTDVEEKDTGPHDRQEQAQAPMAGLEQASAGAQEEVQGQVASTAQPAVQDQGATVMDGSSSHAEALPDHEHVAEHADGDAGSMVIEDVGIVDGAHAMEKSVDGGVLAVDDVLFDASQAATASEQTGKDAVQPAEQ